VKEKICVALDVDSGEKAKDLVFKLRDYVGYFKVGMQLFTSEGPNIVKQISSLGGKVFLDLKYHDIPNTVSSAAIEAVKLGASIVDVHASGGLEMMEETAKKITEKCNQLGIKKPMVLAITVLTSINSETMNSELRVQGTVEEQVVHLAKLTQKAGLDGVVASPLEIKKIRAACGPNFIILTPGIRPYWSATNDQKRFTTPSEAVRDGANILVIGRPITSADDPVDAARKIIAELS